MISGGRYKIWSSTLRLVRIVKGRKRKQATHET
jgi:hypothetical protein